MARTRKQPAPDVPRVVGYVRVSTEEQADSGAGLGAQRLAVAQGAAVRGWEVVEVVEDAGASAKSLKRPGLRRALGMIEAGEADVLMVAKLDRLSRSLLDFTALMEQSRRQGWSLVALDLGVDTSTPAGEMLANVLATFAQFERRLIGQRTKEALAVKRAEGVRLGRPRTLPAKVVDRIRSLRAEGLSLKAIAEELNGADVPTAQGGAHWHPSTVRVVLLQEEEPAPV